MIAIIPITMLIIGLANLARADGNPRLAMRSLVSGVVINLLLAPFFIFQFHWGVWGAALATACAQIFSLAVLIWYFVRSSKMRLSLHYLLNLI